MANHTIPDSTSRQIESHDQDLFASELLARSILDQATEAIVVCDAEGRVQVANQVAYRLCGTDPLHKLFDDVFPLRSGRGPRPWHLLERRRALRVGPALSASLYCSGDRSRGEQVFMQRADGTAFNLVLSAGPLANEQGQTLGCIITLTDVTQCLSATDELDETQARFRRLAESNIIGIVYADERTVLEANDAFLDMVGYDLDDLRAGKIRWREMTAAEYRESTDHQVQELIATGRSRPYEKEYLRKDGSRVPVLIGAILLDAKPFRSIGFVVNLEPRRTTEQALRLSEDRFAKAFLASPDGMMITRLRDGRLIEANERWETIFGYPHQETSGSESAPALFPDPDMQRQLVAALSERGSVRDIDFKIRRPSGETRLASISAEKITIGGETCMLAIVRDITEHKQAEDALQEAKETLELRVQERTNELAGINEALHQSRAELQALLESAPDAIVSVDAGGRIVLVNDQTERMFGFRRDELLGQSVEKLIPRRYQQAHVEHRGNFFENPSTRPMGIGLDLAGMRKDGSEFPVEISLSPVQTADGVLVMSIIRDITERWRTERAMASQATRLQEQANLIDLAHDTIIVRDMENHILFWNHGAEETYGWTREQAIGQVSHTFLQTKFPEALEQVEARLVSAGQWEGELVHTTRNGQRVTVASRQVLQRDESNRPRAILEINRDITARKLAEEKLSASETRFRQLVQQVSDYAIFGLDAKGYVTSWSLGAERLNGYRAEEIIGKQFAIFFPPEDIARQRPQEELERAAAEGHYEEQALRVRQDGSQYWADVVITALRDPNGELRGFSKVIRDITARKQAEEEIHKLNSELERRVDDLATLNQELEAFSYSVSHDLRAPLRGIAGFTQALSEDYDAILDEQGKDYTRRINAATQRMTQLIDDLLTLSRVSRTEMNRDTMVDLSATALSVAAQLQSSLPERQVEFVVEPSLTARGDPRLVRIALENLLGNAWKFTSKIPQARIEFGSAGMEKDKPIYFVRDNGAGFDMTYADKLFGPFQRLHTASEFPGTGIGLATVQRIIRRHGGRVWAESKVGEGATFYFTL